MTGISLLKQDAVPSVFNWTKDPKPRAGKATKRTFDQIKNTSDTDSADEVDVDIEIPRVTDFVKSPETTKDDLLEQIERQSALLKHKDEIISVLRQKNELCRFGIQRFGTDDNLIQLYTGFNGYSLLYAFFQYLEPSVKTMVSAYHNPSEDVSSAGRPRGMLLIDELFMFLCRLRANFLEQDLAVRFDISPKSVSRKLITWVNFLYFILGSLPIWLSRKHVNNLMPASFKNKYGTTRVIIDCTEIWAQRPSSLLSNSQLYSSYKSRTTFKGLIGIAPHDAVTFVSSLYTGNMSDVEITRLCGLTDLLETGDSVMADKGFLIAKLLNEKGATLNIPAFLQNKGQFSTSEIMENEEIASLRIHCERYIRRVKENHMFDTEIPLSLTGSINQFWTVACLLANFKGPLIK